MSTKYRHKKTGNIAVARSLITEFVYDIQTKDGFIGYGSESVPKWVVENSPDWEKIDEKPKVLFITEDKKEITNRDEKVYFISMKHWISGSMSAYQFMGILAEIKLFSAESARDNYIMWHKPLLSLTEAMACVTDNIGNSATRNKALSAIRKAINSKLKQ